MISSAIDFGENKESNKSNKSKYVELYVGLANRSSQTFDVSRVFIVRRDFLIIIKEKRRQLTRVAATLFVLNRSAIFVRTLSK